jgi:2-O-A-mannosyl-D-glycerate-specific PTS system IIC component
MDTKDAILKELIAKLYQDGKISSIEEFTKAVYEREKLTPTGIDAGLAIPHGKSAAVKEASFAVMTLNTPVEGWESVVEGNKVVTVFLLAIPKEDKDGQQMQLLAELMRKMSDERYTANLAKAADAADFVKRLDAEPGEIEDKPAVSQDSHLILGVTACAAGIAHTYMASEALQKAGREAGVRVRVEEQGANGIEHRFTEEELKDADAIILAVDVAVKEEDRFQHLPTIRTRVSAPLKDAKGLIEQAIDKADHTQKGTYEAKASESSSGMGFGATVKASILTGISHVIPLIVAGGMIAALCTISARLFGLTDLMATEGSWLYLIKALGGGLLGTLMVPVLAAYMAFSIGDKPALAAGFAAGLAANMVNGGFLLGMLGGIIAGYTIRFLKKYIPSKGTFAGFVSFVIYPVLSVLITGIIILLILGKPVAALNQGLINMLTSMSGTNAALLGAVIGIMTSFDLGGPVNKAAYAFCVAAMAEGVLMPYCAFASIKMVSAFSCTLATKLRKDLFTEDEREVGNSTWLLGLAGITEGAIPFMMADPLHVIISFCAGSAVCGALVASAGIGLDVPGAGIFSMFVLQGGSPVMSALIWLGSACIGAVISAALLIFFRKRKTAK